MRSFFAQQDWIFDDHIELSGHEYNHIKNVLRMHAGDKISILSGDNYCYECTISDIDNEKILCSVDDKYIRASELGVKVTFFQGLPKSDKMELIIQKSVELGAYGIVPVMMDRSVVKLDEKKKRSRVERWNAIAQNAAMQSRRAYVTEVSEVMDYKTALEKVRDYDHFLFPYECADGFGRTKEVLKNIKAGESVAVFVGPEGGFSLEEVQAAEKAGATIISLGKRILRTETVALMVMSFFNYLFETDE